MEDNDELILFLAVIATAFSDNSHEPISLSLPDFEPLGFKKVNEFVDRFAGSKTFTVLSRPKTIQDKTPYKLEQTEHQKTEYAKTKSEMQHLRDMQMLMIYFGRVCLIYDAITGGNVGFEDGQVNRLYLLLTIRLDKILAKDEFAELREAKPFIYETLMGSFEDLDMAYEFMRPEIWGFYGKLERMWLEQADGLGAFKLEDDEQKLLDDIDKALAEHKEHKARMNANFEKHIEAMAAKMKAEGKADIVVKPQDDGKGSPIAYDDEHGKVTYKDNTAALFIPTQLEGFLFYRVQRADGARISANDIANDYEAKHSELDKDVTTKMLTNAKDRINKKLQVTFGINSAVQYERQSFWLHEKYCSEQSPYKMASSGN